MPDQKPTLPKILPVYPLRDQVLFPHEVVPLQVPSNLMPVIGEAIRNESYIVLSSYFSPGSRNDFERLNKICTAGRIKQIFQMTGGDCKIIFEGIQRVRLESPVQVKPYMISRILPISENLPLGPVTEALVKSVNAMLNILMLHGKSFLTDTMQLFKSADLGHLADVIASALDFEIIEKQQFLEMLDPLERLRAVHSILAVRIKKLQFQNIVAHSVSDAEKEDVREREFKDKMKEFQNELRDQAEKQPELEQLKGRLVKTPMPDSTRDVAEKEFARLERLHPASPEYQVAYNYLDYLCNLPWTEETEDDFSIVRAEQVLDEDHYNLKEIKERILEFLAVRSLKPSASGSVLCFVGPPGVGKTSLGKSIARSLGRHFIRVSLGGVKDEAEIRGHRRTYIGALPGRVIQELFRVGVKNPVFMLDEVDKIGQDFRGDPSSALLEVLDPEQNSTFTDHFLNVPFDLSRIMFITTANTVQPIPAALKDRMEIIQLAGYSDEEKCEIASRHLIPKQQEENGLGDYAIGFEKGAIEKILSDYTREAGVRGLERSIASVFRKIAKEIARGGRGRELINSELVEEYLGPRKFFPELAGREDQVGVATGLAWTEFGGELLFIETSLMEGKHELILTGNLGNVLQESARAALSFIRAHAAELKVDQDFFNKNDIHLHVPSGAVPKDGPSAGVPIVTALISLLTGRAIRRDVAMTGEFSLSGKILPVGGIKEKVLGAHRAGVKTVILPADNQANLRDLEPALLKEMKFVLARDIWNVLNHALRQPI
ncbi:MAG: endopeptidase La [Deltaproteobacteria bacterium]|nr:endopeptidase La [Deltaproteobacteria bacterium]